MERRAGCGGPKPMICQYSICYSNLSKTVIKQTPPFPGLMNWKPSDSLIALVRAEVRCVSLNFVSTLAEPWCACLHFTPVEQAGESLAGIPRSLGCMSTAVGHSVLSEMTATAS